MNTGKIIFGLLLTAVSPASMSAQNINREVEVSKDYLSNAADTPRRTLEMTVPDSVRIFHLNFDYSVFDKPYKGAYEFSPYKVSMTPDATVPDGRNFYLRIGAGYPLRPALKAAWTPSTKGAFRLDLFQDLDGYVGHYTAAIGNGFNGCDIAERFGVKAETSIGQVNVAAVLGYEGIFARDDFMPSSFNSVSASVNLRTGEEWKNKFFCDLTASYTFANDYLEREFSPANFSENSYFVRGTLGPGLGKSFRILVDVVSEGSFYGRTYSTLSLNRFTPRAEFDLGPVRMSAGASLNFCQGFSIYPDVRATLRIKDAVKVYASLSGGLSAMNYSSFKKVCHWFTPAYTDHLQASTDKIDVRLGLCGSIASRLEYDLKAGYASRTGSPVETFKALGGRYVSGLAYADYQEFYADLYLKWRSERFEAVGTANLRAADLKAVGDVVSIPLFRGAVKATYNWHKRIYVGASLAAMTSRKSALGTFSEWADLGIGGEYKYNSKLSFFLQAGNLLNMKQTMSPMHIPGGINFTGGVSIVL